MRNDWFLFMDLDGGNPHILPRELSAQSGYLFVSGISTLQETFNCISKFAGALLFWFSGGSSLSRKIAGDQHGLRGSTQVKHITSSGHNLAGFHFDSKSKGEFFNPVIFGKISSSAVRTLFKEGERLQTGSVLALAAVMPPFDNLTSKVLSVPLDNTDVQLHGCLDQKPCEVEPQRCGSLSFPDLNRRRHAIEPKTGIEFPFLLDNVLGRENNSSLASKVLVGTGSRTMRFVRIKLLKLYAFGFYVDPRSVCEKLGSKYASIPVGELNKHHEFYEDLLREDIDMTVRLVVNYSGMKINTVKDAFEKTLRARLLKTNPDTDYSCVTKFGSYFTEDIPLPLGTTIHFRRTADGQLITEIGGNQIGAVHSKDLCRAFFDMYIGDVPVSEQTKEEIGNNVASMIKRC